MKSLFQEEGILNNDGNDLDLEIYNALNGILRKCSGQYPEHEVVRIIHDIVGAWATVSPILRKNAKKFSGET
jgi:hypothetical protein